MKILTEMAKQTRHLQWGYHSDDEEGYSSFSDTEAEEEGRPAGLVSDPCVERLGSVVVQQPWGGERSSMTDDSGQ